METDHTKFYAVLLACTVRRA